MEKYLRVMADYSCTGLWNIDRVNIDVENLGLSESTVKAFNDWCMEYERNDDYLPEEFRSDPQFDLMDFSLKGLELAMLIKSELGEDWKVVYFDEWKMLSLLDARCGRRDEYEYEV